MKRLFLLLALTLSALPLYAQNIIYAPITHVRPVVDETYVSPRRCEQPVYVNGPTLGTIIGGLVGHAVKGSDNGFYASQAGLIVGDQVDAARRSNPCNPSNVPQQRTVYEVTFNLNGRPNKVIMENPPVGNFVKVFAENGDGGPYRPEPTVRRQSENSW